MALAVVASPLAASAADHLDAPAAKADHRVDITDVYAFRSGAVMTTLVLNVDGLMSPADSKAAAFRTNALYELKVDSNLDGAADIAYRVRFSPATTQPRRHRDPGLRRPPDDRRHRRRQRVERRRRRRRRTTPYKHAVRTAPMKGGGAAFAGARDDPFFFDLPGFVQFKNELLDGTTNLGTLLGGFTASDTFAGTNVLSIAIHLPNAKLGGTGHAVGVYATTSVPSNGGWKPVDRMGRPAINTVFNGLILPSSSDYNGLEKDAFNFQRPTRDADHQGQRDRRCSTRSATC